MRSRVGVVLVSLAMGAVFVLGAGWFVTRSNDPGSPAQATRAYFEALNAHDEAAAREFLSGDPAAVKKSVDEAMARAPYEDLVIDAKQEFGPESASVFVRGEAGGQALDDRLELSASSGRWSAYVGEPIDAGAASTERPSN